MLSRNIVSIYSVTKFVGSSFKIHQLGRCSHTKTEPSKPLPRLIYLANPLKHCWAKFNMKMLKMTWDPQFSEEEFNKGACRVSSFKII